MEPLALPGPMGPMELQVLSYRCFSSANYWGLPPGANCRAWLSSYLRIGAELVLALIGTGTGIDIGINIGLGLLGWVYWVGSIGLGLLGWVYWVGSIGLDLGMDVAAVPGGSSAAKAAKKASRQCRRASRHIRPGRRQSRPYRRRHCRHCHLRYRLHYRGEPDHRPSRRRAAPASAFRSG